MKYMRLLIALLIIPITISRGENEKPFDIVVVREDLLKATGN